MKGGLQGWKAQKSILLRARCAGVTCPVCGKILFRCTASNAEIQCHKCHSDLAIEVAGSRITVTETADRCGGSTEGMARRVKSYKQCLEQG